MPKAIVSHMNPQPQPIVVPKRTHLAKLPSGRFFEFGNVTDAAWSADGETLELVQGGGQIRITQLSGEDALAAEVVMNGISGMVLAKPPTEPTIVTARQMPKVN